MIRLVWDNLNIKEWRDLTARAVRPPLSVDWFYGVAQLKANRWRPHFGILEVDDTPVAMVQTLEQSALAGMLRRTECHGGPVWLVEDPDPAWQKTIVTGLRRRYRPRPGHYIRFYPNAPDPVSIWVQSGFHKIADGYRTIWLDLRPDLSLLHQRLRPNWRQKLNRATKHNVRILTDRQGRLLPWLIEQHSNFREIRKFTAPSGSLLVQLGLQTIPAQNFWLLRADSDDGEGIAASLFLRHGNAATWLVAWSNDHGRKAAAQNALVWAAICQLKAAGVTWFDLGGINPTGAPGLTAFKTGVVGVETVGPGVFI